MTVFRLMIIIGGCILAAGVQGTNAAKYCYCETKLGIPALGIEKYCTGYGLAHTSIMLNVLLSWTLC
jgi:hypothetical protein